ncbi:hypothetical protein C8R47DRAFT_117704 [Mycena vitilis]|nr:hypothetical protein C8R47DRAFT_117704 [Mycena vitilis]
MRSKRGGRRAGTRSCSCFSSQAEPSEIPAGQTVVVRRIACCGLLRFMGPGLVQYITGARPGYPRPVSATLSFSFSVFPSPALDFSILLDCCATSAIPLVVPFLLHSPRRLYTPLILTASLAPMSSATYTVNTIPPPLLAGDTEVTEIWNEGRDSNTIPTSQSRTEGTTSRPTKARLRAVLVSACVRAFRRQQLMVAPIHIPTIILSPIDESDSESDSSDYSESEYSSTPSLAHSDESRTSAGSPPITPTDSIKCTQTALVSSRLPLYPPKLSLQCAAYSYQGGMTRVLSGGVKLGEQHLSPNAPP